MIIVLWLTDGGATASNVATVNTMMGAMANVGLASVGGKVADSTTPGGGVGVSSACAFRLVYTLSYEG